MRYFIFLFFIFSCGKNEMPKTEDLRDSDGDQVINRDEISKRDISIAGIQPIEEIKGSLEFYQGLSIQKKYTLNFSNNRNLDQYSKDLMVKDIHSFKMNEYFSEFSRLIFQSGEKIDFSNEELVQVKIQYSQTRSVPKKLFLVLPDKKIVLGDWKQTMYFQLTKEQLKRIISHEGFLTLSFLDSKANFFHQTRALSIEEKTYRVFVNDGQDTNSYYISKERTFSEILNLLKIDSYQMIDDWNLLTTTIPQDSPTWWIRIINKNDIVIVFENLRNLSNHYFSQFEKLTSKIGRINGFSKPDSKIIKNINSKALIKIRGLRTKLSFKEEKIERWRGRGGIEGTYDFCVDLYRKVVRERPVFFDLNFLIQNLRIETSPHHLLDQIKMNELKDEIGTFWELVIPAGIEELKMSLINLNPKEYLATGHYSSTCDRVKPPLRSIEGHLELKIESYIEKI